MVGKIIPLELENFITLDIHAKTEAESRVCVLGRFLGESKHLLRSCLDVLVKGAEHKSESESWHPVYRG